MGFYMIIKMLVSFCFIFYFISVIFISPIFAILYVILLIALTYIVFLRASIINKHEKAINFLFKEYSNSLRDLRENPDNPYAKSQCLDLAMKYYVTRNPTLSVLELQNSINLDFESILGNFSYCKKITS